MDNFVFPEKGKFTHKAAKTIDPEKTVDIEADYEFFDNGYILVVKNYLSYGEELIKCAERLNLWADATLANSPDNVYTDNNMRSSKNFYLAGTTHPDLALYEGLLKDSFHNCVKLYLHKNNFAKVSADTGYEMLKYDIGCRFSAHIDIIPGHTSWQHRQISLIAYLNGNYEGGELNFPRHNFKFKPEAGSLIIFPSNWTHPHESLPIISGKKFCVVSWIT
jgi:2OG-Fe(II) oxygenase superfamily